MRAIKVPYLTTRLPKTNNDRGIFPEMYAMGKVQVFDLLEVRPDDLLSTLCDSLLIIDRRLYAVQVL